MELSTAVARAVETAQPVIQELKHDLQISLPPEPVVVYADLLRLSQIITNLLTNAAKYTDPGGRIWLSAEQLGAEVVLKVRDTGIGIAPEMLPQVFDLFVQADHASARSQGGLGVGLTLVKNLVEMHGGSVHAHSQGLGAGSEFEVRLPVRVDGTDHPAPLHPDEHKALMRRRLVLVVDDNRDAADSLAMLLRLKGHDVQVANDGPSALQTARTMRPDLFFLDIGMPGMDGYELARRLRKQAEHKDFTLVALTGWGQEADRQRSREAGFDHHLTKPADPLALEKLLAIGPSTT